MRHFPQEPIFWAPGTKIQDGRHNMRNLKRVRIQKLETHPLSNLSQILVSEKNASF